MIMVMPLVAGHEAFATVREFVLVGLDAGMSLVPGGGGGAEGLQVLTASLFEGAMPILCGLLILSLNSADGACRHHQGEQDRFRGKIHVGAPCM
jgi:hypothetical protein